MPAVNATPPPRTSHVHQDLALGVALSQGTAGPLRAPRLRIAHLRSSHLHASHGGSHATGQPRNGGCADRVPARHLPSPSSTALGNSITNCRYVLRAFSRAVLGAPGIGKQRAVTGSGWSATSWRLTFSFPFLSVSVGLFSPSPCPRPPCVMSSPAHQLCPNAPVSQHWFVPLGHSLAPRCQRWSFCEELVTAISEIYPLSPILSLLSPILSILSPILSLLSPGSPRISPSTPMYVPVVPKEGNTVSGASHTLYSTTRTALGVECTGNSNRGSFSNVTSVEV